MNVITCKWNILIKNKQIWNGSKHEEIGLIHRRKVVHDRTLWWPEREICLYPKDTPRPRWWSKPWNPPEVNNNVGEVGLVAWEHGERGKRIFLADILQTQSRLMQSNLTQLKRIDNVVWSRNGVAGQTHLWSGVCTMRTHAQQSISIFRHGLILATLCICL